MGSSNCPLTPSRREFAVVTPYFEKTLTSGILLSHGVWVAGPLSGLIVAPIIGSVSDRCTSRYGRRRPFIVGGLIATVFGMLAFSNADRITHIFFTPQTDAARTAALFIAVCSFCILDLAINTTMWPSKLIIITAIYTHTTNVANIFSPV